MPLALIDFWILLAYLIFVLVVGYLFRKISGKNKEEYFLAGRNVPWWLAGISIVATSYAADTPLAICGIIASKGLSGNWLWLPWMGIHAAVIVVFAAAWRKTGVLTDAQFISIRYSGKRKEALRLLRAGVSGILLNCIILAWVFRAKPVSLGRLCYYVLLRDPYLVGCHHATQGPNRCTGGGASYYHPGDRTPEDLSF